MNDRDLLIALNAAQTITRAALCRLAADLEAWRTLAGNGASDDAVARRAASLGVPAEPLRRALDVLGRAEHLADAEKQRADEVGCELLSSGCAGYPRRLLDHPLPPPVVYCRGAIPDAPAVAVVGSRRMDRYGSSATELFAAGLARAGVIVVSGFALGVDQEAHAAALEVGGKTVAVLGCGLDVDYPRRSRPLAERIARSGALVSEFPLGAEPRAWHFPVRNRAIAALARGTLVVQAKPRSGSLITAHLALDMGREVWAVPGGIFDELSMGTNGLIVDGAALVVSPDDILDQLGLGDFALGGQRRLFDETPEARATAPVAEPTRPLPKGFGGALVRSLRERPGGCTAEDLAAACDAGVDRVLGALLELELGGWVERLPGPLYAA